MPSPLATQGKVTLGIRPEDVQVGADGQLPFHLDIVEELGAHRLLHGRLGDQPFTALVGKDSPLSPGETRVTPKPDAIRLFDTETGRAL